MCRGLPHQTGGAKCEHEVEYSRQSIVNSSKGRLQNTVTLSNIYVPPRPGLADSAAQAAQELFLHHGCAAGNRPWLWGGDFNEDFDESCAHTVAQQFQGSAVGPLHLLSMWKSKVTDLDLVFCNQLPLCSNVTNMTEVLGEHIAKSVTISHMATGFSQRDSPEQRLVETTAFHLQHNMDRNA